MREAKHINNGHTKDLHLIYDGHDSKINDRWYEVGGRIKY